MGVDCVDGLKVVIDILFDFVLPVCDVEEATECGPVAGGRVPAEFSVAVHKLVCFEEVVSEAVAEFDGDVFHFALSAAVFLEVVIDSYPFLVVSFEVLAVVGEEVLFRGVSVYESQVSAQD